MVPSREAFDRLDLCGLTLFVDVAISDHDRRNGAFQTSIWQPAALHLLRRCHHATGRLPLPLPRPLFLWLHQQQVAGEMGVFLFVFSYEDWWCCLWDWLTFGVVVELKVADGDCVKSGWWWLTVLKVVDGDWLLKPIDGDCVKIGWWWPCVLKPVDCDWLLLSDVRWMYLWPF